MIGLLNSFEMAGFFDDAAVAVGGHQTGVKKKKRTTHSTALRRSAIFIVSVMELKVRFEPIFNDGYSATAINMLY